MTEGTSAIAVALLTALAVWGTIALYLGRVSARLQRLTRDLKDLRNPHDNG